VSPDEQRKKIRNLARGLGKSQSELLREIFARGLAVPDLDRYATANSSTLSRQKSGPDIRK
jgi:predicted DNA-binding protein